MRTTMKLAALVVLVCICSVFFAPTMDLPETALRAYRASMLLMLALLTLAAEFTGLLQRPAALPEWLCARLTLVGLIVLREELRAPLIC